MIRFLFVVTTLLAGAFLQVVMGRYLSLYDAGAQVFLVLTVTTGFSFGPLMGEILGFSWGLMSDATGVRLFGMNAVLLALAGYMAGKLRRRVASERIATQIVIALVATVYYSAGASAIYSMFDESPGHFSKLHFFLCGLYNGLFAPVLFYITDRWISFWNIPQEHM